MYQLHRHIIYFGKMLKIYNYMHKLQSENLFALKSVGNPYEWLMYMRFSRVTLPVGGNQLAGSK